MKDLSKLFATELSKKQPIIDDDITESNASFAKQNKALASPSSAILSAQPKTIVQLNSTPFAIDVGEYKNPHSADNPNGDYKAAHRLAQLANAIPQLAPSYIRSLNYIERTWGNLIKSAISTSRWTNSSLRAAKDDFELYKMSSMSGIPDNWYPVYAIPSNWYDIVLDESNLIKMEIDTLSGDTNNNDFVTIDGSSSLFWNVNDQKKNPNKINLNSNTNIKRIELNVLRVDFRRPWLHYNLFNLTDWKISGLDEGYFSNGKLENNEGVFPLITKSMLIGTKVTLEGNFDQTDINVISQHKGKRNNLSIGPFLLNSESESVNIKETDQSTFVTSNVKQIIGYISQQIPKSPSLSGIVKRVR